MPYGYNGKILRADLSSGALSEEAPDEVFYRTYLGGTNFIAHYLLREVKPGADPLGPDNRLVFATGPITGTPVPGAGRNGVGAKSPLTGAFADSQAGGFFGAELKHAGYDAVVLEGQSAKPVYLLIQDGRAELRDASHLWGKTTAETEGALRVETGQRLLRTASIGPAGETLVRYAAIMNDVNRAAGRSGMGAVMGSKKLKAVAARGTRPPALADLEKVRELGKWMADNWKNWTYSLYDTGTASNVRGLQMAGGLPTRNFHAGQFEGFEKISGEAMRDTITVGRKGCYACPVHCKREVRVGEPWNVDPVYGGPEYETLAALGSCCGIDDLGAIAKANQICNAYGVDTISAGLAVAFAMECFENGLLTERDTDGLSLRFGNAQAMVKMVEMIIERRGLGKLLGEGVMRAAEQIGGKAAEYALHVKGQELPLHDPRLKPGLGLGYAISPTGAEHCHNIHDTSYAKEGADLDRARMLGILEPVPVRDLGGSKVRLFYYKGMWRYLFNVFVSCALLRWNAVKTTELIHAITGWDLTYLDIHKVGERMMTMARLFNLREGLTTADDSLPDRLFEKLTDGPLSGFAFDKETLHRAAVMYYQMMGWNDDGVPTVGKLAELDLGWAAEGMPGSPGTGGAVV